MSVGDRDEDEGPGRPGAVADRLEKSKHDAESKGKILK
jgi:hypothetical protein